MKMKSFTNVSEILQRNKNEAEIKTGRNQENSSGNMNFGSMSESTLARRVTGHVTSFSEARKSWRTWVYKKENICFF
jgi:hypothetical protein